MLYFSSQLNIQKYKPAADRVFAALDLFNIKYKLLNNTNDIWARDYMPVKKQSLANMYHFDTSRAILTALPSFAPIFRRDIAPNF